MVIDTIAVNAPGGIAYNPSNGNMYVANIGSNTVSVIDRSNNVIATIPTGVLPRDITFNPSNGKMYVLNSDSGNLAEIDSFSHAVTDTLPIFGDYIAFNPGNGMMYVTSSNKPGVYVISTSLSQQSNANCPTSNVQHWDKIVFKITSPEVARFVDRPYNTELDVKIQDRNAVTATELKSEIARSIGIPHEFRNSIEIVDNGYAVICSPPLPTFENMTNTTLIKNMTDDAYPEDISRR
jgi:YVTN family beta-propeller protein